MEESLILINDETETLANWMMVDGLNVQGLSNGFTQGNKFKLDAPLRVTHLGFRVSEIANTTYTMKLWDTTTQTAIATATFVVGVAMTMWAEVPPVTLIANREYFLTWSSPSTSHPCYDAGTFNTWRVNPPVMGVTMQVLGGYWYGAGNAYPATQLPSSNTIFAMGVRGATFAVTVVPDPAEVYVIAMADDGGSGPAPPPPQGPPDQGVIPAAAVAQTVTPDLFPTGGVPVDFVVAQPAGIYVNSPLDDGSMAGIGVNATSDWLLDPGTNAFQYGTGYTQGTRFRLSAALTVTAIGFRNADWLTKNHTYTIWDTTTSSAIASIVATTLYDGWYWFTLPSSVNLVATREYLLTWYDASGAVMNYESSRTANTWLPAMTVAGVLLEVLTGEYYVAGAVYPPNHNPDGSVFAMGLRGTAAGGAGPSTVTPPPASGGMIAPATTIVTTTPALSVTPTTAQITATAVTPASGRALTPTTAQITATAVTPLRVVGPATRTPPTAITIATAVTPVVNTGVAPQSVTPATAPTSATVPTPIRVAIVTITALAAAAALIALGPSLSGAITQTPTAAVMTSTVPTPGVFFAGAVSPQPAPATFTVPTPTRVIGGVTTTPPAATLTATVPAVTGIAGGTITVPAIAPLTATTPTPTRTVGVATVTAGPAFLNSNVPPPSATAAGVSSPAPAALLATLPAPVVIKGPVSVTAATGVLATGVPTAQVNNTATTTPQAAFMTATAPTPARLVGTTNVTPPAAVMTAIQPSPLPALSGAPKTADVLAAAAMNLVAPSPTLNVAVTPLAATAGVVVPPPLLGVVATPPAAPLSAQAASPTAIPGASARVPNPAMMTGQAITPIAGSIAGGERKITLIVHRAKVVNLRV